MKVYYEIEIPFKKIVIAFFMFKHNMITRPSILVLLIASILHLAVISHLFLNLKNFCFMSPVVFSWMTMPKKSKEESQCYFVSMQLLHKNSCNSFGRFIDPRASS